MHPKQLGENMTHMRKPNFRPEFKLESAQLDIGESERVRSYLFPKS